MSSEERTSKEHGDHEDERGGTSLVPEKSTKRSFDVAFLAGTEGEGQSRDEGQAGCQSAFRKVTKMNCESSNVSHENPGENAFRTNTRNANGGDAFLPRWTGDSTIETSTSESNRPPDATNKREPSGFHRIFGTAMTAPFPTSAGGRMAFPALRKLLDVRNSSHSLEEDPMLEDAVYELDEAKEASQYRDAAGRSRCNISPASATAMASLLSSPLLFPLTPKGTAPLGGSGPSPDMPTGLAALMLPSPISASVGGIVPSNTCAVCGVTFRMTSDLVYHMRTHHAKNVADSSYEKRHKGDKLTCHVCGENFRERHHLTRHMTAHQARKGEAGDETAHLLQHSSKHSTNPVATRA